MQFLNFFSHILIYCIVLIKQCILTPIKGKKEYDNRATHSKI
jgi:hypothetical protein